MVHSQKTKYIPVNCFGKLLGIVFVVRINIRSLFVRYVARQLLYCVSLFSKHCRANISFICLKLTLFFCILKLYLLRFSTEWNKLRFTYRNLEYPKVAISLPRPAINENKKLSENLILLVDASLVNFVLLRDATVLPSAGLLANKRLIDFEFIIFPTFVCCSDMLWSSVVKSRLPVFVCFCDIVFISWLTEWNYSDFGNKTVISK